jgi:hypothetical protein
MSRIEVAMKSLKPTVFNMKCYMAGSDLVKVVTHNVTLWRHTHHVAMGRVHSIHTTLTLLRPRQCVCGYGYKRSRCNNNIKRLRYAWYYQITLKHKLWQPYNISCFNVFGRRLKTMELRSADCRLWNVAFGSFRFQVICNCSQNNPSVFVVTVRDPEV